MYKLINLNNADEWEKIIKNFKNNDVYFFPGYVKALQNNGDGEPLLFYYEDENGKVANITLKRDVAQFKGFKDIIPPDTYFDLCTPYGYGGPLVETYKDSELLSKNFINSFNGYCCSNNIVCDFIRFHPLLQNQHFLASSYELSNARTTIYMDLSNGNDYVWNDFSSSCRNKIKKAEKSGVRVIKGRNEELLESFKKIYYETMNRDRAAAYYYFSDKFFEAILEDLTDNFIIFGCIYQDKIISAGIMLYSSNFLHYHLMGTSTDFMKLAPNNLILYEAASWGIGSGMKYFHLGGGHKNNEDSLFEFKKSFSKSNRSYFYTARKVFDSELYDYLTSIREKNDSNFIKNNEYFPAYRASQD